MNTRLEEAKSKMFSKGFLDFESPEKIDYVKEIEILKKEKNYFSTLLSRRSHSKHCRFCWG